MLSFKLYAFFSALSFGCAIINSYSVHEQFYSIIIHLASSKANKLIILNFVFMILAGIGKQLIWFTFGEIREMERIVSDLNFLKTYNTKL